VAFEGGVRVEPADRVNDLAAHPGPRTCG
jgi:hypothetical protein